MNETPNIMPITDDLIFDGNDYVYIKVIAEKLNELMVKHAHKIILAINAEFYTISVIKSKAIEAVIKLVRTSTFFLCIFGMNCAKYNKYCTSCHVASKLAQS